MILRKQGVSAVFFDIKKACDNLVPIEILRQVHKFNVGKTFGIGAVQYYLIDLLKLELDQKVPLLN